jgi:ABC-type Zn uptake system ZnuABC Zn-binding protein ZnuA
LLWEAWLKVFTNNKTEAIINNKQDKDLEDYSRLMQTCFHEAFRILKAGRWMTVVFSNTQTAVWQSLKTNIEQASAIKQQAQELEKRHEKQLLREFKQYQQQKRLKKIRTSALLVGFKQAWKKPDYQTIITIAKKFPKIALYEDGQLLQFYDLAGLKGV